MVEQQIRTERPATSFSLNIMPGEFEGTAKAIMEEFSSAQTELIEALQESHRYWINRAQSRAYLASGLTSKLTAARSVPDALTAYQEWNSQWLQMMGEDGKHVFADTQKIIAMGARLFPNGWWSKGRNGLNT